MEQGISRRLVLWIGLMCSLLCPTRAGFAQSPGQAQITWEVANRFRLFTAQRDFDLHVNAWRSGTNGTGKSILETEQALEKTFDGRGWAASVIGRLCYNSVTGRVPGYERATGQSTTCQRDNAKEDYLNPDSHLIKLRVTLPPAFSAAQCTWTIGDTPGANSFDRPCNEIVADQRVPDKKARPVHVVAKTAAGQTLAADATVLARDFLIVGLGDSIASGEGNPDQPIALSDKALNMGFCFNRVLDPLTSAQFFLPGRAKANVAPACQDVDPNDLQNWDKAAAGWLFASCHRSLYSYQIRTALALAVENPDISVTFIPLGCTGATIKNVAEHVPQYARERQPGSSTSDTVPAQLDQLTSYLGAGSKLRPVDLIFLTVGANDIGFSGLVADVIVNAAPERDISELFTSVAQAQKNLDGLKGDFTTLRARLAPFVAGNLQRVLFVTYGDPAQYQGGKNCPSSHIGFDAHPAFSVNGAELTKVVDFVENQKDGFLKTLKDYAFCGDAAGCSDPAKQRMTFVADHQKAFGDHGFCATDDGDPPFDKACFRDGGSFAGSKTGLENPLTCGHSPPEFRPYAERARWIRTANDSYFTAMTYPWAPGVVDNPTDVHDGRWGLASVVYGGALHPTAEGHAAMADAALAEANTILKLPLHSANSGFVQ
jgi:hypothetical protein